MMDSGLGEQGLQMVPAVIETASCLSKYAATLQESPLVRVADSFRDGLFRLQWEYT